MLQSYITEHAALLTGLVLFMMMVALLGSKIRPVLVFSAVILVFLVLGLTSIEALLTAATTKNILIIFIIIALSAVLNTYINIPFYLDKVLGRLASPRLFMLVMCLMVVVISAFLNNTPVVILLIPYLIKKASDFKLSPSKLLIPLSFSAILGGMITLIGTSTNLVLNGFLEKNGLPVFGFFDFTIPGILVAVGGILFFVVIGFRLLPSRASYQRRGKQALRKYFVEAKIGEDSLLAGQSIAESGLKDYKGVALVELIRGSKVFDVLQSKNMVLLSGDHLLFSGSITDVMQINAQQKQVDFIEDRRLDVPDKLTYLEVSVPSNSVLEGKKINESNFRQRYGATILAVHRNGEDLRGRIGEMRVRGGDLLLIVPHSIIQENLRSDFFVFSSQTEEQVSPAKVKLLGAGVLLLIVAAVVLQLELFLVLGCLLALVIALGFTHVQRLKNEFNLNLYVILISSLVIGDVFINSGLAQVLTDQIMTLAGTMGSEGIVLVLMGLTVLLTSFVTNVAAVSIAFPLAYSLSLATGIPGEALYLAIAFSASAAFISPIGYQTNLLIMAPGEYVFKDFMKIGIPFTLVYILLVWGYLYYTYQL